MRKNVETLPSQFQHGEMYHSDFNKPVIHRPVRCFIMNSKTIIMDFALGISATPKKMNQTISR